MAAGEPSAQKPNIVKAGEETKRTNRWTASDGRAYSVSALRASMPLARSLPSFETVYGDPSTQAVGASARTSEIVSGPKAPARMAAFSALAVFDPDFCLGPADSRVK